MMFLVSFRSRWKSFASERNVSFDSSDAKVTLLSQLVIRDVASFPSYKFSSFDRSFKYQRSLDDFPSARSATTRDPINRCI